MSHRIITVLSIDYLMEFLLGYRRRLITSYFIENVPKRNFFVRTNSHGNIYCLKVSKQSIEKKYYLLFEIANDFSLICTNLIITTFFSPPPSAIFTTFPSKIGETESVSRL